MKGESRGDTVVIIEPENEPQGNVPQKRFYVETDDEGTELNKKLKRSVSLWLSDAILLCVEHLQLFALILSMSLSWPWPLSWIQGTTFVFVFNLDLWEITKVHTVYEGQTHAFEDPNTIPFSYFGYTLAWLVAVVLVPSAFACLYAAIPHVPYFNPIQILLYRAQIVRLFLLIAQIFCLPFGLVLIRLLDCQYYTTLDSGTQYRSIVLEDTECLSVDHLGISLPLVFFSIFYFVVLPGWMIYRIRMELISPAICTYRTWRTHEKFLLLKETEYILGLDITWAIDHFPTFSSFRRPWVWFRPFSFFAKGIVLALYGALFYSLQQQAIVIFTLMGVFLLLIILVPVYRLRSFNLMLIFSIFINLCNLLLGLMIVLEVQNALLVGENLLNAIIVINTVWFFAATVWFAYLVLRNARVAGTKIRPSWPILSELDVTSKLHSNHTEKFVNAIMKARQLLERCYSLPELFAPVHELSRQIKIINAYCREAELLRDPTHPSLWTLLAEMVDLHTELTPHSIFRTSTKGHLSQTTQKLLQLMPAFKKRLDQREYDLILWTPIKRRILLKLLAVATFMNIRSPRVKIRIESAASGSAPRVSHTSTLTFLQDDTEESNDDFLLDVEKWEQARCVSMSTLPRKPGRQSILSTGSTQRTDAFLLNVEKWEHDSRVSMDAHRLTVPRKLRHSTLSSSSVQSNDAFLQKIDKWEEARRSSLAAQSTTWTLKPASHSSTSKPSVRFTLDTISETEGMSRPSSTSSSRTSENTDVFIDSINERFPV